MDQQSNGINIVLHNVSVSGIYFWIERNNVPFTTNPARGTVIQPRPSNRNNGTNTHTRENPQTPVPNTNNNPPIQPAENQPPPSNKRDRDEQEETSSKRHHTTNAENK